MLQNCITADDQNDFTVTDCKFEWKIRKFLSLPPRDITFSKIFQFSNKSWRVYIIPESTQKDNSINIGFKRESFGFDVSPFAATIGIKRAGGSVLYSANKPLEYKGCANQMLFAGFMDRTPLLTSKDIYLPEGTLTIVWNFSLQNIPASATENILPEKIDSILVRNLEDLLLSELETDVVIKIKDKQFKSHRFILVARSRVFAAMFQHDMAERQRSEVEITDCDPESFKDFLLFIYTGKTDQVTSENAVALYTTADKYGVSELKEKCTECMSLNLSIDSVCDVLEIASMHNESGLLRSTTEFFMKNMKEILQTEKWMYFQCKHFNLVTELFLKFADFVKF